LAGRYHGGRVDGDMTYQQAIARSYTDHETFKERPFLLDNVWDLQHLLDVLSERPDVDERRIGITGWVLTSSDVRSHTP
jgi:dienelactone hydrolase